MPVQIRLESCGLLHFGFGGADERIERQNEPPFIFAREFSNLQRAGFCGSLPVDETRAIRGQIIANRIEVVAAPAMQSLDLARQQRENFVKVVRRLDVRVDDKLHFGVDVARFFEEAKREFRANAEGALPVDSTSREKQFHFLPRGAFMWDVREINRTRQNLSARFLSRANNAQ